MHFDVCCCTSLHPAATQGFQSAYRVGYSTETALCKIVNDICTAAGEGRCTALLASDISAAFDAFSHSILCQRLQLTFGMNGSALHWPRSFVSGCFQRLLADRSRSRTLPFASVVSHKVYYSDGCCSHCMSLLKATLPQPIMCVFISMPIADDTQKYITIQPQCLDNPSQLINCTDDITHCFFENGLCLNLSKTEAVVFGNAPRQRSADITGSAKVVGNSL